LGASAVRAIDTNVLVRLATRDDEKQARAAEECIAAGAWVSQVVLAEAMWVLASLYGASRTDVADTVSRLLDHAQVVIQDADVVRAALDHFTRNKRLSFPDCLILEIARKAGQMPLCTFDRDLAKLDGVERIGAKA
jgi:predicted nucleic-acid-binding protein